MTVTPCPPGHALHSTDEEDEYQCQCKDDDDQNIVSCVDENQIVLKVCMYVCVHACADGFLHTCTVLFCDQILGKGCSTHILFCILGGP